MWAGRADAYARSFAKLCAHPAGALLGAVGVAAVGIDVGTRVLDVGTGPGTVAGLAVARGARVTAVDADPGMLDLARSHAPGADVRLGTLPDLTFAAGAFDATVANFVVNHVGDPRAALTELRRVTRPGGRVAVTIWPHPASPLHQLWGRVLEAAGAERPATTPSLHPELDFDRTSDGLSSLLREAGLADVTCRRLEWNHRADPEDWWSGPANGVASVGLVVTSQTPEMIVRLRQHYDRLIVDYRDEDGLLCLPTAALLAAGRVA